MNAEDLKKLLAEATPGPWEAESGHVQQNGTLYWQVTDGADAIMQNQFCWTRGDAAANAALVALAPDLAARVIELEAENARLREALEPVLHWYQSDEQPDRPLLDIIADIVADLQVDRTECLRLTALLRPEAEAPAQYDPTTQPYDEPFRHVDASRAT